MSNNSADGSDEFAAAASRRRALADQLAERPLEDVLGVVDASGAGGWLEEDDQWTLAFTLHCWKIPPGPLKAHPLSVEWTASRRRFDALRKRVRPYAVVRIRARVVEESVVGTPQAQLTKFFGLDDSDPKLNQAAADLQAPVVLRDHQFGDLTLDRRVDWYTAETEWNGKVVTLNLSLDDSGTPTAALQVGRSLWQDQQRWAKRIQDYAVRELLPLKNENWLDEDKEEAELTAEQFKARMTLESITVRPDGSFDFWHDDGDLFWGHSIQVWGSLTEGPTGADIPG
jgi:hypothetical protein